MTHWPKDTISADDLLAALHRAGYPVRRDQLDRWQRAGVVDAPIVKALGRGKGKVTLYPHGSPDILLGLLGNGGVKRNIREQAWRTWWSGEPMGERIIRQTLEEAAAEFENARRTLRRIFRNEASGDTKDADELYESAAVVRLDSEGIAQSRRRIGRARYSTFVSVLGRVFATVVTPLDLSDDSIAIVERGLGVDHAKTDTVDGAAPWYDGCLKQDLQEMSAMLGRHDFVDFAKSMDMARIEHACAEASILLEVFPPLALAAEQVHGRHAFGWFVLKSMRKGLSVPLQGFVLIWIAIMIEEGMEANVTEVCNALRELKRTAEAA